MDLNVAVATNELFENNDTVFPILMGRENLKVSLASPGSESSGVSSLDAEEAKKMANDQMATSNSSPESASEPNSSEQTEGESSDESNETEQSSDDETSTKRQPTTANGKLNVTIDEQEQRSPELANKANVDETKTIETNGIANDNYETKSENENEQVLPLDLSDTTKTAEEIDLDDGKTFRNKFEIKDLKLIYGGRDILDLTNNLNQSYNIRYTYLPVSNATMYMANRSQYDRIGSSWETMENHRHAFCRQCNFLYVREEQMVVGQASKSYYSDLSNRLCDLSRIAALTEPMAINNAYNTLMQNMTISSALNRISPFNSTLNPATPKFQPSSKTPLSTPAGQMFNFNNMMNSNNNLSNNNQQQQQQQHQQQQQQSFGYQNSMSAPNNNNMSVYKQQQQQQQQQQNASSNAFYGNMTLNSIISQMAMDTNNSAFNPNQYLNGGGNGTNYTPNNINQMVNNLNPSTAIKNRQNQCGVCRPLANKSGINLNANSHNNKMPAYKMYSHF